MNAPSISVVLPAFNEEENLRSTVTDAVACLNRLTTTYEIIIVNDGSTDSTDAVVQLLCDENPHVRMVSHTSNRGYGAAVRSGFAAACCDLVFLTDADGQFSFGDLPGFVAQINSFDAVIGYRQSRADARYRLLISFVGNWIARQALGLHMRDMNCAFKLFRRDTLQTLPLKSDGAMISAELLACATRAGWRIRELPVPHRLRAYGSATGAKPAVIWRTAVEFISVARAKRDSSQRRSARIAKADDLRIA